MIGNTKLSEIRSQLRKKLGKTDAELREYFQQLIDAAASTPGSTNTTLETLELFRDALLKESKKSTPRRKAKAKAQSV